MADNILDIVHRISYEVTGQNQITAITARFNENVQSIGRNVASLARLQQQLNATTDPARQARLQQAIQNRTRAINEQGQAITTAIQNDRQFQRTLQSEIGIINEMNGRLRSLRESRERATSTAEIRRYTNQIREVEQAQRNLTTPSGSALGGLGSSLLQGLGIGSGIALFQQASSLITGFIADGSRMAAELEGVKVAFDRLNDPDLLSNLRAATKGTVSDLELMKNAVQFSNFGLPVERMAEALRFARIRAKETGVEVDYLIQSIVTGIGRQSPLILDNLGINTNRVAEEFARTGDFAEAAFNIISEEANKAGEDLDTFTERAARMNATIDNAKTKIGQDVNDIIETFKVLGLDAIGTVENLGEAYLKYGSAANAMFEIETSNSAAFKKLAEDRQKQIELLPLIQERANTTFLLGYKRFVDEFKTADQVGRARIVEQARAFNETLNAEARLSYAAGSDQLRAYLEGQAGAFQRFMLTIKKIPVNVGLINATNVRGLTREQLQEAQTANDLRRNSLTGNDAAQIASIAATDKLIKDQLDKINGQVAKAPAIRAPRVAKIDFEKLREDIRKGYLKLVKDINNDIRTSDEFLINPSKDGDIIFGEALTNFAGLTDVERAKLVAQYEIAIDQATEAAAKAAKNKSDAAGKDDNTGSHILFSGGLQADIIDTIDLYGELASAAQSTFNQIASAKQEQLNRELSYQEYAINQAQLLAERGNTEALKEEERRLQELQKQQREAAKEQQVINSALTLSYAIAAVAKAALEGGGYASIATVAAVIAALGAGYAFAQSFSTQGFKDGVIDLKGPGTTKSDSIPARLSRRESVMTAEATERYKPFLQMMNDGTFPVVPNMSMPHYPIYVPNVPQSLNQKNEIVSMKKELREIKDVLVNMNSEINVNQNINENGVSQIVERVSRANQKRFRRG